MQSQHRSGTPHFFTVILSVTALVLLTSSSLLSQESKQGRPFCDISGTWYGGSVVAYQVTIIPTSPPGHYTAVVQGMLNDYAMKTAYTGELVRKGNMYEGPEMELSTSDSDFLKPPPIGKMPDITAVWASIEMVDCNTTKTTIPFFGTYLANSIWEPASSGLRRVRFPSLTLPMSTCSR